MHVEPNISNEQKAALAFSKQAPGFDEVYGADKIIQYKRKRVRDHVLSRLGDKSHILELNAGTGEDALFFADLGHFVHATDISEGMQFQLKQKTAEMGLTERVSCEVCSFTHLHSLKQKGPYDMIFSNFAGLNCTNDLAQVFQSFDVLLKPGGIVTLVVLPPFCLWESLLVFKGKFRTAFRRFYSNNGRKAKVEGVDFTCWYHSPKSVIQKLGKGYTLLNIEGLCSIVPPSYIEHFGDKYPRMFKFLCRQEDKLKSTWPWKYIGDYYIISFKKK